MRIFAFVAAALVLAGCGGTRSSSPTPPVRQPRYPAVVHSPVVRAAPRPRIPTVTPPDIIVSPPPILVRSHAALISPTRLQIVTLGSSSCPSVPDELSYTSRHAIRIHLTVGSWVNGRPVARAPGNYACTLDYGPASMVVEIDPKLIDVHRALKVSFFYRDSKKPQVWTAAPLPHYPAVVRSPLVIPVKPAERNRLHIRGFAQFVSSTRLAIVTWGSGSCPAVPDELTVVNPTTLRVHLAHGSYGKKYLVPHLPRNKICTTDLATTPMLLPIDPTLIDVHHRLRILGLQRGVVTVAPLKR